MARDSVMVVPSSAFTTLTKQHWSLLPRQGGNDSSNETDMNRLFPPNPAPGTSRR